MDFKDRVKNLLISRRNNVECGDKKIPQILEDLNLFKDPTAIAKYIIETSSDLVLWCATNEKQGRQFLTIDDYKVFYREIVKREENFQDTRERKLLLDLAKKFLKYQGE